jgi:ParB family chromosome partitioning protein
MGLLAVVVAESLAVGTGIVDVLGTQLKVDVLKGWQPDDTLFQLIRDKEALGAMLAEVAGKQASETHLTATGAKKKGIIRMALDGNGRAKKDNWKPKWMAFPQAGYTKRALTSKTKSGA